MSLKIRFKTDFVRNASNFFAFYNNYWNARVWSRRATTPKKWKEGKKQFFLLLFIGPLYKIILHMKKKDIGLKKKNLNMWFSCSFLRRNLHLGIRKRDFAEFSKSCLILSKPERIINAVLTIKRWKNKDFKSTASLKMWSQNIIHESTKNCLSGTSLKSKISAGTNTKIINCKI